MTGNYFVLTVFVLISAGCMEEDWQPEAPVQVGCARCQEEDLRPGEPVQVDCDGCQEEDLRPEEPMQVDCAGCQEENWRPEVPAQLDCGWLSQQPFEGANTLDCGPTTLVMAAACIDGYAPEYNEVVDLMAWMESHVGYTGNFTNTVMLETAANSYYDLRAQKFYASLNLEGMYEDLLSGVPILVGVRSQGDNTTDIMELGNWHFMLLVGMTQTHVIFNDPQPYEREIGENRSFTIESFQETWQNGGVQFLK